MKPIHKATLYLAIAATLALVFAMYTRPDFMMTLTNQIWGCF